jgi:CheY-like chemotaxis protein/anti-sigma regulatory factor (Ser/Thr protein kinase)
VRIDPVALEQVIVNLAVNAHDAMADGGTLTISVDESDGQPADALVADSAHPPSIRIRVSDTGAGMDEVTAARVFDPFFTTKEVGKGTGLGLATVYGLVRQSSGTITLETAVGKGSTFTILLPKIATGSERGRARSAATAPNPAVGVVLMVEDEPSVREFARRVLNRAGHTLLTAGHAQEAIRAATDWVGRIDVLLTDVVMPGMHGPALAAKLSEARPGIRVIYMSGYAQDVLPVSGPPEPSAAFLAKPFTADALAQVVAREIELAFVDREQLPEDGRERTVSSKRRDPTR